MVATFGKLDNAELTLEPGLNILTRPNEWGKSTWCAFLAAMLYGLDTRAKSTKTALADKERYAPWSGKPMAGRIDLRWQGRDITIERRTKGRIPLGEFRAYETASGLPVPELTAANCGQLLVGAEQSVYRRAGFIRLDQLPVTQDESLRRRLNALVTTGDESGDGAILERELRELRNRCRYNRTGLIPQAEQDRGTLKEKLRTLEELEEHRHKLLQRLEVVKQRRRELENHGQALAYAAAQADACRVAAAREETQAAEQRLTRLEALTSGLPEQTQAEEKCRQLRDLIHRQEALAREQEQLPRQEAPPEAPAAFRGMTCDQALEAVERDEKLLAGPGSRRGIAAGIFAIAAIGAGAALLWLGLMPWCWVALGLGAALLVLALILGGKAKSLRRELEDRYGSCDSLLWHQQLDRWRDQYELWHQGLRNALALRSRVDAAAEALDTRRRSLCGAQEPGEVLAFWERSAATWEDYHRARREYSQAAAHLSALEAMAKTAPAPALPDRLTHSPEDTAMLLEQALAEQERLAARLGEYRGRIEAMGDRSALEADLARTDARLAKLEQTYAALTLALETLAQARQDLQRRFAPRITSGARQLLETMTGGRYDRLRLEEDLSLTAGTQQEETLREALWRSDGTVDQLYLALRLAMAQELTPEAPLVLDEALARFDDDRLAAALEVLKQLAQNRQVILFTCQDREQRRMEM